MIIDAHAHYEPQMLGAEALLAKMDTAGIDRVALIPVMSDPLPHTPENLLTFARKLMSQRLSRPLAELIHRMTLTSEGDLRLKGKIYKMFSRPDNESVAQMIEAHPERFLGWIFLNPSSDAPLLDELESWRERPGMIGVKLHPHWHDYHINKELCGPLFSRCEELGLPLLIHLGFRGRGDFRFMTDSFPKLRIVSAHAGFPFFGDLWKYRRDTPNLYVDLSSPYLDERVVGATVAAMGPRRCLYGTDSPYGFKGQDGSYDYSEIIGWIERLPVSTTDLEDILGGNFQRIMGD